MKSTALLTDTPSSRDTDPVRESLIVVLPGGGYGPLAPALRFPILACQQIGNGETIEIAYLETSEDDPIPTRLQTVTTAVSEQVSAALERSTATDVVVIAKSLGTRLLAAIASSLPQDRRISAVWLTPLFGVDDVCSAAARSGLRSLMVAGTADPHHDQNGFDAVRDALGADALLIPDADHSLEIVGDVFATLDAMRSLTSAVLDFAR
ncbi:hypothetical protein BH10ACT2_BH10ACT2_00770 [soil metagenome]